MHILFLTDNFPPEVNAPASRTYEHCRKWVEAGHRVTVITGVPNFPKGHIFDEYKNKLWQQERMAGIHVIRVWTYIAANEGFIKRSLDYLSFMITGFLASFWVSRVDVVVGTSPQFFTVCAAYAVGLFKRVPWVFELRDIWPESIRVVGAMTESKALDLLERLELFLYRKATAIVSVTNSMRNVLIRRHVDEGKIYVVTNGVDTCRFSPRDKDASLLRQHQLEGKFVAGYIGTHGLAHALNTVLQAAKMLKVESRDDRFRFLLIGDGADKSALLKRAREEGLDNVIFVDTVHKDQVVRYWSVLDVSIIHLKEDELFTAVIPSKLFECMGMGIPVLHGVEGESADIVEREDVGIPFKPECARSLLKGLELLADDPALYYRFKANGPIAAQRYNRSVLAVNMLNIMTRIVRSKKN